MHHSHDHDVFRYANCPGKHPRWCRCKIRTYGRVLLILGITAIIEFWASDYSNSAALWADAWHVVTDMCAIAAVMVAAELVRAGFHEGTVERKTIYVQIFLFCVIVYKILGEGFDRWENPQDFLSGTVIIVAILGLFGNLIAHRVAHRAGSGKNNLAALLHILFDALTNVAVIANGAVKWYTDKYHVPAPEWIGDWRLVDPATLFLVTVVIGVQIFKLLFEEIGWIKPRKHH